MKLGNYSIWVNESQLIENPILSMEMVSGGLCMLNGKTAVYTYVTFLILLATAAVFENAIVLVVLCKYKRLQKLSYVLFGILAMIDLITGSIVLPFKIWLVLSNGQEAEMLSFFIDLLIAVLLFSSATVLCINIDCSLRIFCLRTYRLTKKRLALELIVCWFVPLVVVVGMAVQYNYLLYLGVVFFLVTTVGLCCLFGVSACWLNRLLRTQNTVEGDHSTYDGDTINTTYGDNSNTTNEDQWNTLKTAFALTTVCTIMNFPTILGFVLTLMGHFSNVICALGIFALLGNAVVNPIIYVWRVSAFRNCIKDFFCKQRMREEDDDADIAMMTIDDNLV